MFMLLLDLFSALIFLVIAAGAWWTFGEWRYNHRCTREAAEIAAARVKMAKRLGYDR